MWKNIKDKLLALILIIILAICMWIIIDPGSFMECIGVVHTFEIQDTSNRPDTIYTRLDFVGDSINYAVIYPGIDPNENGELFYSVKYIDSKGIERSFRFKGIVGEYKRGDTVYYKKIMIKQDEKD